MNDPSYSTTSTLLGKTGNPPSPAAALVCLMLFLPLTGAALLLGPLGVLAWLAVAGACFFFGLLFLYRCWQSVPEEQRPAPPALLACLTLVPVVNLYWMFAAVRGLSRRTAESRQTCGTERRDVLSLATACCVLWVSGTVLYSLPYLKHIYLASMPVVFGLWMLAQTRAARREGVPGLALWTVGLFSAQGMFILLTVLSLAVGRLPSSSTEVAPTIDADQLGALYQKSPERFAQDFKGRLLRITGNVASVDRENGVVVLERSIYCKLAPGTEMPPLESGQSVTLVGHCGNHRYSYADVLTPIAPEIEMCNFVGVEVPQADHTTSGPAVVGVDLRGVDFTKTPHEVDMRPSVGQIYWSE